MTKDVKTTDVGPKKGKGTALGKVPIPKGKKTLGKGKSSRGWGA